MLCIKSSTSQDVFQPISDLHQLHWGDWEMGGACFPRNCLEIRCSEIALRPFWDRSRAMIATWLEVYCIQFWLSIFAFAKPADIEFPRAKVLRLAEQEVGWQMVKIQIVCREYWKYVWRASHLHHMGPFIFRKIVWCQVVQLQLHCWRWFTRTTGELSSAWIAIHLCTSFHRSSKTA